MSAALGRGLGRSATMAPARVLICDDSVVIRNAMARLLDADTQVHVMARTANGRQAVDEVARHARTDTPVDVVVLDIEMPVMDGMEALPAILGADPGVRILMASTLTTRGADIALRAMRLGAADYVAKPSVSQIADDSFRRDLLSKVKVLAAMRRRAQRGNGPSIAVFPLIPPPRLPAQLLAVGSSTGGPQALFNLIQGIGQQIRVPVVLTQHMPATFTPILADHLNRLGGMPCREARDGEVLVPGHAYVAPGDQHLLVSGSPGNLHVRLSDSPAENFCRPSVDPMLRSATETCRGAVLAVILTGMGHDGLAGARQLVAAGGGVIAQDEATSVVWGMPGAVAQAGLCCHVLPLPAIAGKVLETLQASRR